MSRLFGPVFIAAGLLHFIKPKMYEAIMPPYLPAHRELVYCSGVAEIAGGALLLHPRTRRAGMFLSIATLLGVFPANVHMAVESEKYAKALPGGAPALYARLPVQALFIWWAWRAGRDSD
jgi:uncharacterized membrane protein